MRILLAEDDASQAESIQTWLEMDGYTVDWVEQDLIGEAGFPNDFTDGMDAIEYQLNLRDTYQDLETDLECGGRDGMFEDTDRFVVWDKKDITKLRDYLNGALEIFKT